MWEIIVTALWGSVIKFKNCIHKTINQKSKITPLQSRVLVHLWTASSTATNFISLCVHHTGRFSFTWQLTVHNVHSISAQRQLIKWTEWPGACCSPSTPHSWRCALNSSTRLSWVTWVLLYQSNVRLCFLTTSSQSLLTTYLTCLPGTILPSPAWNLSWSPFWSGGGETIMHHKGTSPSGQK